MAKRILVVDDDRDIVICLANRLTVWGFNVETALNGVEAIEALKRAAFDGIVLGIIMPYMNGYEVLSYLRGTGQKTPVIIYSALVPSLHENNPQDAYIMKNVQALLPKPVTTDELKLAVDRCFGEPLEPRSEQASHDEALRDLAITHARMGRVEAARETASQITDHHFQRWACMQILYAQFYAGDFSHPRETREDLNAVKATIASLADDSLWYGSWIDDLLRSLVNSGDSAGAMEIVGRIKEPFLRALHYGDVGGNLALKDHSDGVEEILSLLSLDPQRMLAEDIDMVDIALGKVAIAHAWIGRDLECARQYAARIGGPNERKSILKQIEQALQWFSREK